MTFRDEHNIITHFTRQSTVPVKGAGGERRGRVKGRGEGEEDGRRSCKKEVHNSTASKYSLPSILQRHHVGARVGGKEAINKPRKNWKREGRRRERTNHRSAVNERYSRRVCVASDRGKYLTGWQPCGEEIILGERGYSPTSTPSPHHPLHQHPAPVSASVAMTASATHATIVATAAPNNYFCRISSRPTLVKPFHSGKERYPHNFPNPAPPSPTPTSHPPFCAPRTEERRNK
ncbi:uncharacterized protein LOC124158117 [Ischnura elegans]|uniref:uncharacterized protein LOC124158117 n=1 Tax=Ischnura elegans TaxID=197161 RepID=UPI001ED8A4C1|nr:uncharacterized protein LOC124158117 [Ischnura elegans]